MLATMPKCALPLSVFATTASSPDMNQMDAPCQERPKLSNAITARVLVTFRLTAQLCVLAELEPVAVATIVVNQDIWLVLAQAQLAQVVFPVLAAVSELLVVDMEEGLRLVVDLRVDPVLLLATSAADQTTLLVIAKLRP